jgi:hypothetical protein
MSKKEDENIFLKNQKIPETLDMYFKNYVQNGDYGMLINITRDYISRDTTNIDVVIHNLKIEKKQIEIDKTNRETRNIPIFSGIIGAATTGLVTFISNLITADSKGIIDNILPSIAIISGCLTAYMFTDIFSRTMKEAKLQDLKNSEKIDFLDFCIKEYTKKYIQKKYIIPKHT